MDIDSATKIVLAAGSSVAAMIGVGTLTYNILIGDSSRKRESYRFAKEFFEYKEATKDIHPFVLEKGYQAISGDSSLKGVEVEYLLLLEDADRSLKDYILGKKYLECSLSDEELKIFFKDKYQISWSRKWRMAVYGVLYALLSAAAFAPMMFNSFIFKKPGDAIVGSIFCLIFFGSYAYLALKAGSRIYRAQILVASQNKYHQNSKKISLARVSNKRL